MGIFVGGGITIGGGISFTSDGVVANVSNVIGYYTITLGTKTPVLGNTGQSPFPANGWTSIISASGDDANTVVSLPFTWKYNNTDYNSFYPNSNYYVTFGSGSTQFNALSASNPAFNKIFFAGADNSWQRVSRISSGTDYLRLRWEGTNATSGTPGSPNMVYELTFFNPVNTNNQPVIELLIGAQARGNANPSVISGLYSANTKLTGGDLGPSNRGVTANQSYILIGNSTGTSWNVYTGYHLANTGY